MATEPEQTEPMGRRRALLTDRERELIANPDTEEENYRYQSISRVRNKIEDELPKDVEILEENHPVLLGEFRSVVCADSVDDADAEVDRLRELADGREVERDKAMGERDKLQSDLEECRAQLEQADEPPAEVPIGQLQDRLSNATDALERHRDELGDKTPEGALDDATLAIERSLEVLEDA